MFEHLGAEVLVAADGQDALNVLANEEVDVIFCDLRMPNMDGYEFIRALRHRRDGPQPPVTAISGQASSGEHRRTHAAGFDGHIDKPFVDTESGCPREDASGCFSESAGCRACITEPCRPSH
jgi:CheY-like chemotaxis protein